MRQEIDSLHLELAMHVNTRRALILEIDSHTDAIEGLHRMVGQISTRLDNMERADTPARWA